MGYGPVGQALALALGQQGHDIVVIERSAALHPLPRAVGFDHETARILQSLGLADDMAAFTALSERYEWRNADGRVLKSFAGLDQPGLSGWPDKLTFCQPELEKVLDARLRALGGPLELLQGWEAVKLSAATDHVQLAVRSIDAAASEQREIRARYVVGCDGARSFVRHAMDSRYEELGFSADWLVIDIRPKDPRRWTSELLQICDPKRPTTAVASGPGRRRFEFMLLPGETKEQMNRLEVVWSLLAVLGWTPDDAHLDRHAVYTFGACIADCWRRGRVLLAGDAAHLTPPFAGQGLCAGLRDVAALSWRLHLVLRGNSPESLLDTYPSERLPHVRVFTEFSIMLGGVICVLDAAAAASRDAFLLGPGAAAEDRYPEPRLTASSALRAEDPHAGELSLQARVRGSRAEGRFDDIVGRGFVLLGLDHDPGAELSRDQHRFLERIGAQTVSVGEPADLIDLDGAYRRWFATLGHRAVLIRPDFYVFGAGEARELVTALAASGIWASL